MCHKMKQKTGSVGVTAEIDKIKIGKRKTTEEEKLTEIGCSADLKENQKMFVCAVENRSKETAKGC